MTLPPGTEVTIVALHGAPHLEAEAAKLRGQVCTVVSVKKDGDWWEGSLRCPDGDHWYMFMKLDLVVVDRPSVQAGQTAWVRSIRDEDPNAADAARLVNAPCVVGVGAPDAEGWWAGSAVCDGTPRTFTRMRWDVQQGGRYPSGTRVRIVAFGPTDAHGPARPDLVGRLCTTRVGTDDEPWWGGGLACDGEELFVSQVKLEPAP